jgi:hypothetical protein
MNRARTFWQSTVGKKIVMAVTGLSMVRRDPQVSTFAARTIRWSGALILLFVALHLLHLTTGTIQPVRFSTYDVYANIVGGFRIWWVSAFYIVSMIALGLHNYHGACGSFRTVGASRPRLLDLSPDERARGVVTGAAGYSRRRIAGPQRRPPMIASRGVCEPATSVAKRASGCSLSIS